MQLNTLDDYKTLIEYLAGEKNEDARAIQRYLCRTDLFFLLLWGCNRKDVLHPWILERCKEVQKNPNGYIDLWSREHYKSTIVTYALTMSDIFSSHGEDPLTEKWGDEIERTHGIFSYNRPIAKAFLKQIKQEFEQNSVLKSLFPDILWQNPNKAPIWSDEAIVVQRRRNPKEKTLEAWGLVQGQPTSKHFDTIIYDDVVTLETVSTPDQIEKTVRAWEMSLNLGKQGGLDRYAGTYYHFNDPYVQILKRKILKERRYPATANGQIDGAPVLVSQDYYDKRRESMGPFVFSCQWLLNPVPEADQVFTQDTIQFHDGTDGSGMNLYIMCDPANEKKKNSDYTVYMVVGLARDNNYYVIDIVRDRLNLVERTETLFELHERYRPLAVGYEKYGKDADIEHIQDVQKRVNYRFEIIPLGGSMAKNDRIRRLMPIYYAHRMYLPPSLVRRTKDGKTINVVEAFINDELLKFPSSAHDDMLDCQARILDENLGARWPKKPMSEVEGDKYARAAKRRSRSSSWAV